MILIFVELSVPFASEADECDDGAPEMYVLPAERDDPDHQDASIRQLDCVQYLHPSEA